MLVMLPGAQEKFKHSIPKGGIQNNNGGERICVTFRCQTDCKRKRDDATASVDPSKRAHK